jgi:hypothetical protein
MNAVTFAFNMYQRNIKPSQNPSREKEVREARILRR